MKDVQDVQIPTEMSFPRGLCLPSVAFLGDESNMFMSLKSLKACSSKLQLNLKPVDLWMVLDEMMLPCSHCAASNLRHSGLCSVWEGFMTDPS